MDPQVLEDEDCTSFPTLGIPISPDAGRIPDELYPHTKTLNPMSRKHTKAGTYSISVPGI
jgi:hypothetical protein